MGRKKEVVIPCHKHGRKLSTKPSFDEPTMAERLSKKWNLPEDVLAKVPVITAYGQHKVLIENYRSITEYTDRTIQIQTKTGKIVIQGKNLVIGYFREDAMCVYGQIATIEYH